MKPKRTTRKIVPAKKIVLVKLTELESQSALEYASERKQEIGQIIAIGSGKVPIEMKEGDKIAFRKFGKDSIQIDGVEYLFVSFADVLGVIA